MLRTAFKGLAVLAVVGLVLGTQQAQAGCRHCGWGSYGYPGGWGSYGYGGGWGSYGYPGGWGSYGYPSGWGYSSGYCAMAPVPMPATRPTPPSTTPPATTDSPTYAPSNNSALLWVKVPVDAKVFINDRPTTNTGTDRRYISGEMQSGGQYRYIVRAEFVRNGQTVSENKTIQLTAGQTANLDFTQGESRVQTAGSAEPRTTLIVRVPAEAKLFLAGQEVKTTGPVRKFSTTELPAASQWANYAIRAVIEKDGQQQVREQTVSLKGGESSDVSVDFETPATEQVANKSTQ